MKKKYLTAILLFSVVPFLSNCATREDVTLLNQHIRALNKKIDTIKEDPTVNQMQKRQANSSSQLDQMEAEILQLKSLLEENGHMNRMLQEQNKELQGAVLTLQTKQEQELSTQLAELNNKISLQEQSLATIRQARIDDANRRSKAAAIAAEEAMRKANAASAAQKSAARPVATQHIRVSAKKIVHSGVSASPVPTSSYPTAKPAVAKRSQAKAEKVTPVKEAAPAVNNSGDNFSQAQQQFAKKQYKKAYTLYEKHTESVGQKESIQARYMMGECLFKQGQYDQAIIQYQQIISSFPGNPQAAKALLKQGEAFEQLSDRDTAKIIYKKITASYSTTPEAEIAKERISSL